MQWEREKGRERKEYEGEKENMDEKGGQKTGEDNTPEW
jgi:hypothetical protein